MARRKARTFTEVELEFMQIIWNQGEVSTEDVMNELDKRGRHLSDGSVRKVLSILAEKGYLSRRRVGRGYLHKAKVAKDQASSNMVKDLLTRAFGGSAALMVAALLDNRAVSKKDVQQIKRLIAKREGEGRK